ncbi:rplB [Symbiodinium pilosum]|uniref:RplB protein n=1 Tax=Symbiodinium pilosum TaxID=2952 RepID=A0A812TKL3_SYMPI|nr:rplB [Symbiodinium pilosum]
MKRNRVPYIDFETGFPKGEPPKQSVGTAFTLAKQQKLERLLEATPQTTFRGRVIKQLSTRRIRHSGRGDVGRITTRHREGGTMQRLRFVDFKRARKDIPASVLRIEYSPERTSHVALIQYQDGVLSYILAPLTLRPGDQVVASETANIVPGNCLPLRSIPAGSIVHNIELRPGAGGQLIRAAGTFATIITKDQHFATIKLRSTEIRKFPLECWASIGQLSHLERAMRFKGKAGVNRWLGWRPSVRGNAMDPPGNVEFAQAYPVGNPTLAIRSSANPIPGSNVAQPIVSVFAEHHFGTIHLPSPLPRSDAEEVRHRKLSGEDFRWAVLSDLDYPNGMGSEENHVHNIFWVANIPGDWMAINQTAVTQLAEFAPTMLVGRNSLGARGMEAPCPKRGMHRYHVVMWSLDSQLDDIDSDISYQALKSLLEEAKDGKVAKRKKKEAKGPDEAGATKLKSADEIFGPSGDEAEDGREEGEEEVAEQDAVVEQGPPGAPTGFTLKWDWEAETSQSPQGNEAKYEDLMLYQVGIANNEVAIVVIPDLWGWRMPRVRLLADYLAQAVQGIVVVPRMLDTPPLQEGGNDDGIPEDYPLLETDLDTGMASLKGWLMKNTYEFYLSKFRLAANYVRRQANANRIGIVGLGWGSWIACYGAEYLGAEFGCAVMTSPLLHRLGLWDGVDPERLIMKCDGPVIFMVSADEPTEYERGGAYFAVNSQKFLRSTECSDFRTMRSGFVTQANFEDPAARKEIIRAFEKTAAFLRKFLWPFPLGGGYAYLRYLASKGDFEAMQGLLQLGVPAGGQDSIDEVEQPPIMYAARDGHREAVKLLVQYEADVNEIGGIPVETALHVAVQSHKFKVVQMLLSLRADPQLKDAGGQGPLHRAAREGAIHALQTLISASAEVDMRDTCEQTPMHIATYFGREEVVRTLLASRADAVAENIRGQTPRKVAERLGYTTIAQIIDKEIERREIEELYAAEERERAEQQLKALLEQEGTDTRPLSKASKRSARSSGKSSRPSTRHSTRNMKS